MTREPRRKQIAHAYSAITVLPDDVCAETNTVLLFSRQRIARF